MGSGDSTCPADRYDSEDEVINKIIALKMGGNGQWVVEYLKAFGPQVKGALVVRFGGRLTVEDIEDVTQAWALRQCASPDNFDRKKGPLKLYCYIGMCFEARRKVTEKITERNRFAMLTDPSSDDLEEVADCEAMSISTAQVEINLILREAIRKLSPRQQEVVLAYMQYGDSLSIKEIVKRLNEKRKKKITTNTFSVSLHRAKERIKKFFEDRGYDPNTLEKNT